MTLIIAGYNYVKGFQWTKKDPALVNDGLFVTADSAITDTRGHTLLNGFRKIYPLQIKVWKPYFIGEYFRDYYEVHFQSECFVAISGSTLTAQYAMNLVTEHLSNLRITYMPKSKSYEVIRHCQANPLTTEGASITTWSEDMFTDTDYQGIVSLELIEDVIYHSINTSLQSAREYKIDVEGFNQLFTEYLIGIQCPKTHEYGLFRYSTEIRVNDEQVHEILLSRERIPTDQVAVIGMKNQFEENARQRFHDALEHGDNISGTMFDFLNESIDEMQGQGKFIIDRPSVLKLYKNEKLEKVDFRARVKN